METLWLGIVQFPMHESGLREREVGVVDDWVLVPLTTMDSYSHLTLRAIDTGGITPLNRLDREGTVIQPMP